MTECDVLILIVVLLMSRTICPSHLGATDKSTSYLVLTSLATRLKTYLVRYYGTLGAHNRTPYGLHKLICYRDIIAKHYCQCKIFVEFPESLPLLLAQLDAVFFCECFVLFYGFREMGNSVVTCHKKDPICICWMCHCLKRTLAYV